jgi:hypothetical protein
VSGSFVPPGKALLESFLAPQRFQWVGGYGNRVA